MITDALPPVSLPAELAFVVVEVEDAEAAEPDFIAEAVAPDFAEAVTIPEGDDPLAVAVVELPVALARNASKVFGLEALTLIANTIPPWQ